MRAANGFGQRKRAKQEQGKEQPMPHAVTSDHVRLYFEEAGSGTPIIFLHEFAADYTNWEPQMRYFSRRHRCIAYSARGYTPSDVPPSAEVYTYKHFYTDALAVLDHLKIAKAHFVGLSMGSYSSLQIKVSPDAGKCCFRNRLGSMQLSSSSPQMIRAGVGTFRIASVRV
jgi:hypothetical protein